MNELLRGLCETFTSNIADALNLMIIGMGTVLIFLCVMIGVMFLMSKSVMILNKYFPEVVPETAKKTVKKLTDDADVAVAVLSAILKK